MLKRCLLMGATCFMVGSWVQAEPMRTLYTKENRLPDQYQLELSAIGEVVEFNDAKEVGAPVGDNRYTASALARVGLSKNLAVFAEVPYVDFDSGMTGKADTSESGLGDITAGLELRVFEDIFGYPWVLPYLEATFDTADEPVLGQGDDTYTVGLALGSVANDVWHFIVDLSYEFRKDDDNIFIGAAAIIWDISDQFSALFEVAATDEDVNSNLQDPAFFQGGMTYDPTDDWQIGAYIAGGKNSEEDVIGTVRVTRTF